MNTKQINELEAAKDFSPVKQYVYMEFDPETTHEKVKPTENELNLCIEKLKGKSENERAAALTEYITLKFKQKHFTPDDCGFELKEYLFKVDREVQYLFTALLTVLKGFDLKWLSRLNITSENYVKALHKVIEVKAEAGDYEKCFEWLQQAKVNRLPLEEEHRNGTMLYLLKQALKMEQMDKVIALFINDTETESNFVHAIVDYILFKQSGREYKVLELYRQLRNHKVDKNTHSIIIRSYAKANRIKEAIALLKELIYAGQVPDEIVFNTLLDGCSKNELIREIEVVTKLMLKSGIAPGTVSYNSIIDGYVRCKEFWKAWDCYKEMQAKHIKADNFTYSSLIKGVVSREQRKEFGIITKLFDKIKLSDKPDEILYNCMIDSCVATNHFELALSYFQEMKQHGTIRPDLITYNTLIKGCALNNDSEAGMRLIEDIESRPDLTMNAITFNTLIDLFVRCNNLDTAYRLIGDMAYSNLKPDSFTYSTLMKGVKKNVKRLPKEKTIEQCFGYVQDLINRKVEIDDVLFNCLIDVCIHYKDMDHAIDAYNRMVQEKIYPKTITFGILIKGYGMNGQIDKAFEIFEKYLIDYKLGVNEVTYGTLLDCCVKNHDLARARSVYDRMKADPAIKCNTILNTTVIKMFNLEKNLNAAKQLFQDMLQSKNSYPNNVTFNTMLDTAIKCEDLELAESYVRMMPECGFRPDLITFSTLAKGYIHSHQVYKAFELIKEMKHYHIRPDEHFLTTLFDGCSKEGDLPLVMKILCEIRSLKIKLSSYIFVSLIRLHAKTDQMSEFPLLIDAMKSLHVTPNPHVYGVIMSHCLHLHDPQVALRCFRYMVKDKALCESYYLINLVKYLKSHEQYKEALEVAVACMEHGCGLEGSVISDIIVNCAYFDMYHVTELKILLDRAGVVLNPEAQEAMARLGLGSAHLDTTPCEKGSKFLSHTKSTNDKTFDSNSIKKKTKYFSTNKYVEKLDLEKDI